MVIRLLFSALGLICGVALLTSEAHAGPLMPCIVATQSANGNILVVNELTFDDPDETHGRVPVTSTFRVFGRYIDINESHRVNGTNKYYANPIWSVVFERGDQTRVPACPYLLVTDDGEYVILFGDLFLQHLTIYRRRDHPGQPLGGSGPDHGVLVREVPLTELWSPEHIPSIETDSTPKWFAGGTFAFSSDNRTLIHKTRWGTTLQIDLATGEVGGTKESGSASPR